MNKNNLSIKQTKVGFKNSAMIQLSTFIINSQTQPFPFYATWRRLSMPDTSGDMYYLLGSCHLLSLRPDVIPGEGQINHGNEDKDGSVSQMK